MVKRPNDGGGGIFYCFPFLPKNWSLKYKNDLIIESYGIIMNTQ